MKKSVRKLKKKSKVVFLVLLIILALFLSIYFFLKNKKNNLILIEPDKRSNKKLIPTNTPIPRPIPRGKVGFTVSLGQKVPGPRMSQGFIDPYDPALEEKQTLTIEVNNFDKPVEKVSAILTTDNKVSPEYPLKQIDGTENSGHWQGSWAVDDSYFYNYVLTIKATGPNGTSKVDITLR